jgi:aminoglycoside 6'-N-acetyltransferase
LKILEGGELVVLVSKGELVIKKMSYSESDFLLLYKWLNDKNVLSYIEGPNSIFTYEQIIDKYGPRAKGEHYVTPCIIEFKNAPIGYLQYYQLQEEEIEAYGATKHEPEYGLDIFIGETDYWNMGIGTEALKLIIRHLFEQGVKVIYIDPQTWNVRAIRSYEKCGFKRIKVLFKHELFDGEYKDNQIMKLNLDEFL